MTLEPPIGPPASTAEPPPSAKKLGKRPMTNAQLRAYYAKQPKVADYDSDGERSPMRTSNAVDLTNIPGFNLAPQPTQPARYSPVDVAPEDEHARDLLEALTRVSPAIPSSPPMPRTPPTNFITANGSRRLSIEELQAFIDAPDDSSTDDGDAASRLVPDPFMPDENPRLTAAERDAVVEGEQQWRQEQGIPLLVKDPEDDDRWIDPAELPGVVVKTEAPTGGDSDDLYN